MRRARIERGVVSTVAGHAGGFRPHGQPARPVASLTKFRYIGNEFDIKEVFPYHGCGTHSIKSRLQPTPTCPSRQGGCLSWRRCGQTTATKRERLAPVSASKRSKSCLSKRPHFQTMVAPGCHVIG